MAVVTAAIAAAADEGIQLIERCKPDCVSPAVPVSTLLA